MNKVRDKRYETDRTDPINDKWTDQDSQPASVSIIPWHTSPSPVTYRCGQRLASLMIDSGRDGNLVTLPITERSVLSRTYSRSSVLVNKGQLCVPAFSISCAFFLHCPLVVSHTLPFILSEITYGHDCPSTHSQQTAESHEWLLCLEICRGILLTPKRHRIKAIFEAENLG